jgi:hypothetical protein
LRQLCTLCDLDMAADVDEVAVDHRRARDVCRSQDHDDVATRVPLDRGVPHDHDHVVDRLVRAKREVLPEADAILTVVKGAAAAPPPPRLRRLGSLGSGRRLDLWRVVGLTRRSLRLGARRNDRCACQQPQ